MELKSDTWMPTGDLLPKALEGCTGLVGLYDTMAAFSYSDFSTPMNPNHRDPSRKAQPSPTGRTRRARRTVPILC